MKYAIYLYFASQFIGTKYAVDVAGVRAVCQQWWNANPSNRCVYISLEGGKP